MFDPVRLFKSRLSAHLKLLNRYLRYIFNGHFMIALMFFIIAISVYYQKWLESLSENFPAAIVIGIVLAAIVTYNPIQSFLKEPDKIFLIVKEAEMKRYFIYVLGYNYIIQLYVVLFGIAAISPMYMKFFSDHDVVLNLLILLTILVVKLWNLNISWRMLQYRTSINNFGELLIRIVLNFALFYTLLMGQHFLLVGFITIVYYNVIHFLQKNQVILPWEKLIENDEQRLASFYRFVSLFADVPHVKHRLRKRRLLTNMIKNYTKLNQKNTYSYLYKLTFLRGGDYFRLFIRLTIIGAIVIYFVPNIWFKLALALVIIYMTSFQLITLFYHHRVNIWLDLYPVSSGQRETSFLRFMMQLAFLQTAILATIPIVQGSVWGSLIILSSGTLFNYLFHQVYVKRKIKASFSNDID